MVSIVEWQEIPYDEKDIKFFESLQSKNDKLFDIRFKNGRYILKARNYVGVIALQGDRFIEILPKVWSEDEREKNVEAFVTMLTLAYGISYEKSDMTRLMSTMDNIFEVFIRMYLDEALSVFRKGMNRHYRNYRSNEPFLRGKLLISEDIKKNFDMAHFYVEYEIFDNDSPENRLIKHTVKKLIHITKDNDNRRVCNSILEELINVSDITDYESEFKKCVKDRNTKHYGAILAWSRLFLRGLGMNSFHGEEGSFSFLFPMELVYQGFVANSLKLALPRGWSISTQDKMILFDNSDQKIIPDIVVTMPNGRKIILDTKWKNPESKGLSVSDIYQMFVYSIKYKSIVTYLIYPESISVAYHSSKDNVNICSSKYSIEEHNDVKQWINSYLIPYVQKTKSWSEH